VSSEAEKNKALVRRFMEARAKADLNAIEEMMAPEFISHGLLPGQHPGREGLKRTIAEISATFSNRRRFIEDQLAEADKVVTRYTLRATHDRKEIMGVAPTGREVTYNAIVIHRISGGKIAEEWGLGTSISELMGQRLEQERIERERIEQELQVARRIQQASLPKVVPQLEGWQITPFYRPAREVGGDFYDFHLLSEGRVGSQHYILWFCINMRGVGCAGCLWLLPFRGSGKNENGLGQSPSPNSERGAPLEIPIPLHHDLKTARGLLLGRTSENSVLWRSSQNYPSARLGV
jgi:predicted ester cyclase